MARADEYGRDKEPDKKPVPAKKESPVKGGGFSGGNGGGGGGGGGGGNGGGGGGTTKKSGVKKGYHIDPETGVVVPNTGEKGGNEEGDRRIVLPEYDETPPPEDGETPPPEEEEEGGADNDWTPNVNPKDKDTQQVWKWLSSQEWWDNLNPAQKQAFWGTFKNKGGMGFQAEITYWLQEGGLQKMVDKYGLNAKKFLGNLGPLDDVFKNVKGGGPAWWTLTTVPEGFDANDLKAFVDWFAQSSAGIGGPTALARLLLKQGADPAMVQAAMAANPNTTQYIPTNPLTDTMYEQLGWEKITIPGTNWVVWQNPYYDATNPDWHPMYGPSKPDLTPTGDTGGGGGGGTGGNNQEGPGSGPGPGGGGGEGGVTPPVAPPTGPPPGAGSPGVGGFDAPQGQPFDFGILNDFGFGDVVSEMLRARENKLKATMFQAPTFDLETGE